MLYMIIEHFRDGDPVPVYRRLRDEGRLMPHDLRYVASWVTEDFRIKHYDPQHAPDPKAWLALDEGERTELVLQYHRRARVRLPNVRLHATIHVIVENQVALGDEIPVRRTLERLRAEGLDRHDAVQAVGSVVAKRIYELLKEGLPTGDPNEPYWAELESLTAEGWRHGG